MTEVEIIHDVVLTDEQVIKCEMHSFINLVNSIFFELQLLADELDSPEVFAAEMDTCILMVESFRKRALAIESVHKIESIGCRILQVVRLVIDKSGRRGLESSYINLESMLQVAEVRSREFLARFDLPGRWVTFRTREIREGLHQVLEAIARHSHGRFGFVYDQPGAALNYGFSLHIVGGHDGHISLPPIFIDCLRDLVANARKYTQPGGNIEAWIRQGESWLEISVSDTGAGIPADEIPTIVGFGVRGSNVQDHATRGGGFGLTKVWYATKQYGGRLWIASREGAGTRVRIRLPVP
jgi:signal transduction histidine kinase